MRPSTSSRPSSSAGLVSTSTLLQPLRLASAVLRPLNLPADFEGGDPASSRVVISDAATDDSLNKPASLAPHQVADEPKASGASSLALQAHATHAAQLSELLASTNVSDKPAAASDPSDALDGVLANLQKQRQRIAAQQQAAEQPRPEAPSMNPAPAAAAAPSASADAEQGEAEEDADEEDEEVEEVLFRCFPSHVASLFSAGSAELREMAIDRLSTHLRETAAADDEDDDEEGGGMTSLHAFAAEAELAAANVEQRCSARRPLPTHRRRLPASGRARRRSTRPTRSFLVATRTRRKRTMVLAAAAPHLLRALRTDYMAAA